MTMSMHTLEHSASYCDIKVDLACHYNDKIRFSKTAAGVVVVRKLADYQHDAYPIIKE